MSRIKGHSDKIFNTRKFRAYKDKIAINFPISWTDYICLQN